MAFAGVVGEPMKTERSALIAGHRVIPGSMRAASRLHPAPAQGFSIFRSGHLLVLLLLLSVLPLGAGQKLTLAWDRSVDASVTGYKLYYRELAATNYTQVDVGNTNVCRLSDLLETRTYTFYVTCYNAAGLESDPSNSVSYTVPLAPLRPSIAHGESGPAVLSLSLAAVEGRRVALETSVDVVNWIVLIIGEPGQTVEFRTKIIPSVPTRFYRARLLE
jgi:hypothetical protein